MKKITIDAILKHYNEKIAEVHEAERNELIPLFEKEFPEYELIFIDYLRMNCVWFIDEERRIRVNFRCGDMGMDVRRSPHGTWGYWTQKEVNDIKRRIEHLCTEN